MALDRSKWGWWLLCLLLKQLPQETRPLPGAPPVGTAQALLLLGTLQVLVLCDTWFPKAVLACAMPHRVDRRSGWPPAREYVSLFGLGCSLDTSGPKGRLVSFWEDRVACLTLASWGGQSFEWVRTHATRWFPFPCALPL